MSTSDEAALLVPSITMVLLFDNEDEGGFTKWLVRGMTYHMQTLQRSKEFCRCKEIMNGTLIKGNEKQLPNSCPQHQSAEIQAKGHN